MWDSACCYHRAASWSRLKAESRTGLAIADAADQSDRDEQKGFMMMFSGAVAGLRNPRAHKLIKDDPERALEFIAYVSLLAKLLDARAQVNSPNPRAATVRQRVRYWTL
jgi:hypothetical protein